MHGLPPEHLLDNPEVLKGSPWCVALDNLEMGIVLLALPWVASEGLRRADLERRLGWLDLPLGPLYFQRVKRAVARLEEIGCAAGFGEGRARSFLATPEGFAALLLNLCVLRADPTLEGAEFELKRSLVTRLNELSATQPRELEGRELEGALPAQAELFFAAVDRLTILGEPAVTEEIETQAFDVQRLIAEQRRLVERRLGLVRERPAAVLRYEHYLRYLDDLAALHAGEAGNEES